MPRIEIQDNLGYSYVITSGNAETIKAWLIEWTARLLSNDTRMQPVIRMTVWPLYHPDGRPDWDSGDAANHFYELSKEKLKDLNTILRSLNQKPAPPPNWRPTQPGRKLADTETIQR